MQIKKGGDIKDVIKTYAGIELTDDEVRMIRENARKNPKYGLSNALGEAISEKVGVKFASHKHTGEPVPLMVYGLGAENFGGFMHHTDTSKMMAKLMLFGSSEPAPAKVKICETSNLKGDINGDFSVDDSDAYLTLTLFLGEIADTELEKKVDVDGNGVIDFKDVALIMQEV